MEKTRFSWRARGRSFIYAGRGIVKMLRSEHNAWIHTSVMICVIIAGFLFGISALEWCAVILCFGGVLMAEGFNSAIEALCDAVSTDYHPAIERAKDIAAGAVLLFVIAAVAVGIIIFLPPLLQLIIMN